VSKTVASANTPPEDAAMVANYSSTVVVILFFPSIKKSVHLVDPARFKNSREIGTRPVALPLKGEEEGP
jgi:hypothetical protein